MSRRALSHARSRRRRTVRAALTVVTVMSVAIAAGPHVVADTVTGHSGTTGASSLVDSEASPGVTCRYDAVSGALTGIQARPPRVYAVDSSAGTDQQQVGARARLQRRPTPADAWATVTSGPALHATATDAASPFSEPAEFAPTAPGSYRVRWELTWYDVHGVQTGEVTRQADWYGLRLSDRLSVGVAAESCPASRRGSPSVLVRHGSKREPSVALTFDFGGRVGDSVSIMRWLVANEVPATIFTVGETGAGTTPGRRVLALAAQHPGLIAIGNHSFSHPDFTKLTSEQIAAQMTDAEDAIAPLAGRTTKPWFRPPFGRRNADVLAAVGAAGWSLTVLWNVGTDDFRAPAHGGPTPAELVHEVLRRAGNGSIVILHLGGYSTLKALPGIVAGLHNAGLTAVTLETLLGI